MKNRIYFEARYQFDLSLKSKQTLSLAHKQRIFDGKIGKVSKLLHNPCHQIRKSEVNKVRKEQKKVPLHR